MPIDVHNARRVFNVCASVCFFDFLRATLYPFVLFWNIGDTILASTARHTHTHTYEPDASPNGGQLTNKT